MGFLVLIIIGFIVFIVIVANSETANDSSQRSNLATKAKPVTHSPSKKSAIRPLTNTDINNMVMQSLAAAKIVTPYYKLLEDVLINNLKCLPKSVLEMEFTQTAIQVFILQYASVVFAKKLSNLKYITTICELVMEDLYKKGVLARKDFDPNLNDTDPILRALPMLIQGMSQLPPQNQTMLLVAIEQYMERKEGHRVRYIGQCPADNPLNAQK